MTTTTYNFLAISLQDGVENENIQPLFVKGAPFHLDIMVRISLHNNLYRSVFRNPAIL